MKNSLSDGEILTLTAPSGGVVSGTFYKIGQLIVCAQVTAAQTEAFTAARVGTFGAVPKATGSAWVEGSLLYWNDTNKNFQIASGSGTLAAVALDVAASGDTVGNIVLLGIAAATT